jgi:hypothetical protein
MRLPSADRFSAEVVTDYITRLNDVIVQDATPVAQRA